MGRNIRTREVHDSLCIRSSPKENLSLTHYMLSAWWLHILDRIGHYVIRPGAIVKILIMTNNTMTLC